MIQEIGTLADFEIGFDGDDPVKRVYFDGLPEDPEEMRRLLGEYLTQHYGTLSWWSGEFEIVGDPKAPRTREELEANPYSSARLQSNPEILIPHIFVRMKLRWGWTVGKVGGHGYYAMKREA